MTEANRSANAALAFEEAERNLRYAADMAALGHWGPVAVFAFQAVEAAARALLFLDGLEPRRHAGVRSLLAAHFEQRGRVEAGWARWLAEVEALRNESLYVASTGISEAVARARLADSERFVRTVARPLVHPAAP